MIEITASMAKAGLPAVMLIVGEQLGHAFYLGYGVDDAPSSQSGESPRWTNRP